MQLIDIKLFIKSKNLSQRAIVRETGYSEEYISKILNDKVPLNDKFISSLIRAFPDILQEAQDITSKIDSLSRMVPVFDQYAFASEVSEWDTPSWLNERQYISTTLPEDGKYYWFPIKGDSMCNPLSNRSINDGDYILGRELYRDHWRKDLHLHRVTVWIIITPDGVMCKEIIKHNKGTGIITCHSWNDNYNDFDVNLDDVIKLYYFKELKRDKL